MGPKCRDPVVIALANYGSYINEKVAYGPSLAVTTILEQS